MPEGPSIVILKDAVKHFKSKKVIAVSGNTKIDKNRMLNQTIIDFKSWGKHFLICFKDFSVRIHFMLFGTYRINERKINPPRLSLRFKNGELNFYACSVRIIEEGLDEVYDWSADVMNEQWSPSKAKKKIVKNPAMLACDALMDQQIFSGVGNIIKNEVLFRIRVHPESKVGKMPAAKISALIREARKYSFEFLEWKKAFVLKKHFLAYSKKTCPRDHIPFALKILGKGRRRCFFCNKCQKLYR